MKHFTTLVLFLGMLSICQTASSQDEWTETEREINTQLWIPFMQTYNSLDAEGFIDLHTDNVIRVNRSGRSIVTGDAYAENVRASTARNREANRARNISFSFLERIHAGNTGFEVGYYKVVVTNADGTQQTFYGKFHVVLTRENNTWKLLVDADRDTDEGFSDEDFRLGRVLELE